MGNAYMEEDYWYEMKYCDLTDEQQQILDIIGYDAFENLIKTFGGSHLYLPTIKGLTQKIKERFVLNDRRKGDSYKTIADRYRLTIDCVQCIIREGKKNGRLS